MIKPSKMRKLKMLKKADAYATPIQLQFDQLENYQTYCGACLTSIVILICSIYFSILMYNFILIKNPNVVGSQFPLGNETFVLQKSSLYYLLIELDQIFAFSLIGKDKQYMSNSSIISAQAFAKTKRFSPNKTVTMENSIIPIVKCAKYIPNEKILAKFYCLDLKSMPGSVEFQGDFNQDIFQYIAINVKRCQNLTSNTCLSPEEIESKLYGSSLEVVFTNYLLDFTSGQNNYQQILTSQHMTYQQQVTKELTLFMKVTSIQSKLFDLFAIDTIQNLLYDKNSEATEIKDQSIPYQAIFRLTDSENYITLCNQNILNVLSDLGGLWNILLLIGSIFFEPFKQFSKKISISNRIFLFEKASEARSDKMINQEKEFGKIRVSVLEYISYFLPKQCCRKIKKSERINQIEYAWQLINDKLDILYIIKKIEQFERVTKLLLSQEQSQQLNILSKRTIWLDSVPLEQGQREQLKISRMEKQILSNSNQSLFSAENQNNNFANNQSIELQTISDKV